MTARKTVWRVGVMGAGRSGAGDALAARLGVAFVDGDALARTGEGAG